MKKTLISSVALAFLCVVGLAGVSMADKGPADIHFDTKKPVQFPHAEHQGRMECKVCHHSKDDAGKKVEFVEGQAIGKCASCHDKLKDVGHKLCKTCHKESGNKKLTKCGTCHPKKK